MAAGVPPPPPEGWQEFGEGFFFIELRPPGKGGDDERFDIPFATFIVSVKSDSALGAQWNNDPLAILTQIDAFGATRDDQVIALRVNAEVPANPRLVRSAVLKIPGSTMFVIVHYKHPHEPAPSA